MDVVTMIGVFIMGVSRMRIGAVRIVVVLDLVAAGIAPMRTDDRDQPGKHRADQRQKNDCLDHVTR